MDRLFQKPDPGRFGFDSVQLLDPERKIGRMIVEMPLGRSNSKYTSVSNILQMRRQVRQGCLKFTLEKTGKNEIKIEYA